MKRRKKSKTREDIIAHFQKRCIERIGIVLNQKTLRELMVNRKLIFVNKQSNSKTHFRLKREDYSGREMLQFDVELVYDKLRHGFVTVWKYGTKKCGDLILS